MKQNEMRNRSYEKWADAKLHCISPFFFIEFLLIGDKVIKQLRFFWI